MGKSTNQLILFWEFNEEQRAILFVFLCLCFRFLHGFYFPGIEIQRHRGNGKVWVSVLGFCFFFLVFDVIFGKERHLRVPHIWWWMMIYLMKQNFLSLISLFAKRQLRVLTHLPLTFNTVINWMRQKYTISYQVYVLAHFWPKEAAACSHTFASHIQHSHWMWQKYTIY